jgi:beta-lactam-binding protein with PASTA domain
VTPTVLALVALVVSTAVLVVALTRGAGPKNTNVVVCASPPRNGGFPSVVGLAKAKAQSTLALATLRPSSTSRTGFDAPPDFVASQCPAAVALVSPDSNVLIEVTTGTP